MKGVWVLLECFSDGCSYWSEQIYSIHESEEGASLAEDVLIKLQSSPRYEGGSSARIEFYETKP
jgi:hypothetical protein